MGLTFQSGVDEGYVFLNGFRWACSHSTIPRHVLHFSTNVTLFSSTDICTDSHGLTWVFNRNMPLYRHYEKNLPDGVGCAVTPILFPC